MNGRTIARAAAAAASLGIGAVLTFSAPAGAEQNQAPVDSGLAHLTEIAGADPSAQEGIAALTRYAGLIDAAHLRDVSSVFTPFSYAAPTFGCGSNGPPGPVLFETTPGEHTYSLRYADCGCDPADAEFSDRTLTVAPRP